MGTTRKKLLLATDAWRPQVNGVVRTWETTIHQLQKKDFLVNVIDPSQFSSWPIPFYREIHLALPSMNALARKIQHFQPDFIHIATEGPIGLITQMYCRRHRFAFTTSYHTKFPEYLNQFFGIPLAWSYYYMRRFHRQSRAILIATPTLENELKQRGFKTPMKRWSRGVDLHLFHPKQKVDLPYPRPILLYVGRVSREKGIEDFLKIKTPGSKVIIGDGPLRPYLQSHYPDAIFLGYRKGNDLAQLMASADLFVFPSKTDTFGLVIIEALACGVPVAAYPVAGPIDIITRAELGALDDDLSRAILLALDRGNRQICTDYAQKYSWESCTNQLIQSLVPCQSPISKSFK